MSQVNESAFYMWRTLFALAHADDVVTDEELRFMAEALEDIPFSDEQRAVLNKDVSEPQDIEVMFEKISNQVDQAAFFKLAKALVHIDGDYGVEEQVVMLRLKEKHLKNVDVDALIGNVGLELESEGESNAFADSVQKGNFKDALYSFRSSFLKKRFKD